MSKEPNRNVYVGHRYVPLIMGEWDKSIDYEGLSIVTNKGNSYTSKKRVPVGIDILNEEFWVVTGNYNAQVDYYRQETERVAEDLLLKSDKTYVDTELGKKADTSFVNTELGKKADTSFVNTELGKKSDKTYVDTELGKKSDKTYVDTELDKKSNISYVDTELGKKADTNFVNTEMDKVEKRNDILESYAVNLLEYEDFKTDIEGVYNWSPVFNEIFRVHGNNVRVEIPEGEFNLFETVKTPDNYTMVGSGVNITYIKSNVRNNAPMFDVTRDRTTSGLESIFVEGITFDDDRSITTGGYAFEVTRTLNATFEKCIFRNMGGGAIKATALSNLTTDKVYIFNNGRNENFKDPENGALHFDRSEGYGNTLNVNNTYISNCQNLSGISAGGHSIRIVNATIESCDTLLNIGSSDYVSRNITILGLYMENPKNYGINISNVRSAVFLNTYVYDTNSTADVSVKMSVSTDVRFINCNLGDKGFNIDNNTYNVTFNDCTGLHPNKGIPGVNDDTNSVQGELASGYFGESNNLLNKSNVFTDWNGSVIVNELDEYYQGFRISRLTKNNASDDMYKTVTRDFSIGEKVVFSVYSKGLLTLRLRGRRKSDGVYENISQTTRRKDEYGRIYTSATLINNYDLIHARMTPGEYAIIEECFIFGSQFENGSVEPGTLLNTKGRAIDKKINGSTNGLHYSDGFVMTSPDGLTNKKIGISNTGEITITDL